MRFIYTSAVAGAALLSTVVSAFPASSNQTDALARKGLAKLAAYEAKYNSTSACNTTTAHVRKEWDALCASEKREYIDAVLCLQSLPALSGSFAPGAQSRYDDFVAMHINLTLVIHATVRVYEGIALLFSVLKCFRQTSFLGTATSRMPTRPRCAMNVDTQDISHT